MARQEIQVFYSINGTTCNTRFTYDTVSITMAADSAIIQFAGGQDGDGRKVYAVGYKELFSFTRYIID